MPPDVSALPDRPPPGNALVAYHREATRSRSWAGAPPRTRSSTDSSAHVTIMVGTRFMGTFWPFDGRQRVAAPLVGRDQVVRAFARSSPSTAGAQFVLEIYGWSVPGVLLPTVEQPCAA